VFREKCGARLTAGPASSGDTGGAGGNARSCLHANCAFCHRPDQPFASIDLRFDVTAMLKNAKICNAVPAKGGLGVANATLLTPRSPATSVTWLRMNAPATGCPL
jgi:hypothetical protein